eukprot:scaffold58_cov115-Isochrysis_galbana.AAC.2
MATPAAATTCSGLFPVERALQEGLHDVLREVPESERHWFRCRRGGQGAVDAVAGAMPRSFDGSHTERLPAHVPPEGGGRPRLTNHDWRLRHGRRARGLLRSEPAHVAGAASPAAEPAPGPAAGTWRATAAGRRAFGTAAVVAASAPVAVPARASPVVAAGGNAVAGTAASAALAAAPRRSNIRAASSAAESWRGADWRRRRAPTAACAARHAARDGTPGRDPNASVPSAETLMAPSRVAALAASVALHRETRLHGLSARLLGIFEAVPAVAHRVLGAAGQLLRDE